MSPDKVSGHLTGLSAHRAADTPSLFRGCPSGCPSADNGTNRGTNRTQRPGRIAAIKRGAGPARLQADGGVSPTAREV